MGEVSQYNVAVCLQGRAGAHYAISARRPPDPMSSLEPMGPTRAPGAFRGGRDAHYNVRRV